MDTSVLSRLFEMAPDLMEEMELRALVLERVAALGPIGRRALAARLNLAEREVRSAADALKLAGCLTQNAAGMILTAQGQSLIEPARLVSRRRRSFASIEQALSRKLNIHRVCVVSGDADKDGSVMEAAAAAAAQQLRFWLHGVRVLAVSGGEMMAQMAEAIVPAAPIDVMIVPAQGGMGGSVRIQANTVAERFAARLGGQNRMLYLPEGISASAAEELVRLTQVREVLEYVRNADLVFYGIDGALGAALQRGVSPAERESLLRSGAIGEAVGFYLNAEGTIIGSKAAHALNMKELGGRTKAAAVSVGHSRAEAIIAVCMHHEHALLVTDEGAAHRMMELLRV